MRVVIDMPGRAGRLRRVLGGMTAAFLAGTSLPAWSAEVETIVVTAQKREEALQSVPTAVTAFSSETLSKMGAVGIEDIARHTPSLQFGNYSDLKLSPTSIRGIIAGTGSAGQDPSVGYYLDEVFLGPGVSAIIDLYDIQRVEILRGPQGTLFGRNTIGGVISIVSQSPDPDFGGYIEAEYGNYEHMRLKGRVSGPIVEGKVNASLSVMFHEREGFTENAFLGTDGDDTMRKGARLAFDIFPSENLSLQFGFDYLDIRQHSKHFETLRYNPVAGVGPLAGIFGFPLNTDPFDHKVYSDVNSRETLETWGGSLRATLSLEGFDVVSVTGYRSHEYFNVGDTDVTPLDWGLDGDPEEVSRFSQEIRLVSDDSWNWDWLVGGYYFHQETDNLSFIELGSDLSLALTGDPAAIAGLQAGSSAQMEVDSYAAFASVTLPLDERLDLTLGGRYTYEEKTIAYTQDDPLGLLGGTIPLLQSANDWSAFTPAATLSYHWTDDVMAFATYSQGFKSGGYNDALGDVTGISFDPEFLTNYELGLKSDWLERRLRVNVSLFYMEWEDIQIAGDDPSTPAVFDPITTNAGKAHSQGVELEFQAVPTDALELGGYVALMEAEFDEGAVPAAPPAVGTPLTKIPRAPDYKWSLWAEYGVPVNAWMLSLRGEVIETGTSYLSINATDPDVRVDPYTLVNGRIALSMPDDGWQIALWGKNLTDEVYLERLFDLFANPFIGEKLIVLGQPRTYGVELRKKF